MSIELVMVYNYLILCCPLLLLLSIFPSIRVFSNKLALPIRWPEYWSFSFSISPSNKYSGLISFRIDWFDPLLSKGLSRVFSRVFPCGSAGKESACNVGYLGSIPGLERSPGEGKGYPLQYSGLESSMNILKITLKKKKRVFSSTTIGKHQFFGTAFLMVQLSYPYMTSGKTVTLTIWTFVGRVMSPSLWMIDFR